MKSKSFELPIRIVSEANSTEHWTKKAKRHKEQAFFVKRAFHEYIKDAIMPCTITMIRLAPRELDSDNLQMAFKWIRDELADFMFPGENLHYIAKSGRTIPLKGRRDSEPGLTWAYEQRKSKSYGIIVQFDF